MYPAYFEEVLSIGALGPDMSHAYYSTYNDQVDFCAPGGDGSSDDKYQIYSTAYPAYGQNYSYVTGTSFAAFS